MACGICGGVGHNRRTCSASSSGGGFSSSLASNTPSLLIGNGSSQSIPKRTVTCGMCGRQGHNRRTCTSGSTSQNNLSSAPRRTVTCGVCGQQGHNRRTCTSASSSQSDPTSAPRRTVTCGICGQQGHNRRTCTSGSSSQNDLSSAPRGTAHDRGTSISSSRISDTCCTDDKPCNNSGYGSVIRSISVSRRMATCGTFGQQGHNRQTSTFGSSTQNCINSSTNGRSGSTSRFGSFLSLANASSATRKPVICGTCGQQGHNASRCTASPFEISTRIYSTNTASKTSDSESKSSLTSASPIQNKTISCGKCGQQVQSCEAHSTDVTFVKTNLVPNPTENTVTCDKCQTFGRTAETCPKNILEPKHEKPKLNPNLDVSTSEPKIVDTKYDRKPEVHLALKPAFPLGRMHLNEAAQEWLDKGPTKSDGEGYIYLYKNVNPTSGDSNLFKIGMTKNLPDLTMRQQKYANNADYFLLFSKRTKWRYLTEDVIHAQLKSCRDPRSEGDGKTEWFRGQQEEFIEIIEKCQKIVDAKYTSHRW